MAVVVALLPDLLFGSKVHGMLSAAGHEVRSASTPEGARERLAGADVVVVDLCEDAVGRVALAGEAAAAGARTLAFYLHTDADTRAAALDAGFDRVVPRSRMAREGAALVDGLLARA